MHHGSFASSKDVALFLLEWLGKHLLIMSTLPFKLVVLSDYTTDYKVFATLKLCTSKLCIRSAKKVSSSKF
jgi:hypothetical protein